MKKTVVEIECSRCHRREYLSAEEAAAPSAEAAAGVILPALIIRLDGIEVAKFDDLCAPCKKAVQGYIENLSKPMEKKSPDRKKKDKASEGHASGAKKEGANSPPHSPKTVTTSPRP
jgi:hypothetical protein